MNNKVPLVFLSLVGIAVVILLGNARVEAHTDGQSARGIASEGDRQHDLTSGAGSGASFTSDAPRTCTVGWNVVPSPDEGTVVNTLAGLAAVSANDVWAVGSYYSGTVYQTLTEHWNGTSWSIVPSPNPGTSDNRLVAVAAVSTDDVWAVGYFHMAGVDQSLVLRWNGTVWIPVSSPQAPSVNIHLTAITVISATDIWAVGGSSGGAFSSTLTQHWNGTNWAFVTSPNVGTGNNYLYGVSAVATDDVWAVGSYAGNPSYRTLILRWDGSAWNAVTSPSVGGNQNYLNAVAAVAANEVWAVGDYFDATPTSHNLILRWDGGTWSTATAPDIGTQNNSLAAIAAVSPNDIWAVGSHGEGGVLHTSTLRWDGAFWNVVTSANAGASDNYANAVAAVSADDAWMSGSYMDGSTLRTLAERYTGSCATPTPTLTNTATRTPTSPPTNTATRTAMPTACPIQFTDVPQGSTFYPFIRCLACRGIINGYSDGTFRPNNNVTRGQLSKIVSNSAGFNDPVVGQMFQDVPPGSTFYDYIGRLASRGYISGYPCGGPGEPCVPPANLPYFRTNNNATRGQISKIVSNAAGFQEPVSGQTFQDVAVGSTFYEFIERLASRGVMSGYPCGSIPTQPCIPPDNRPYFRPNNNATRGQTSKIVANTFFPNCDTPQR